jgi:hypothetical protein
VQILGVNRRPVNMINAVGNLQLALEVRSPVRAAGLNAAAPPRVRRGSDAAMPRAPRINSGDRATTLIDPDGTGTDQTACGRESDCAAWPVCRS